MLLLRQIILLGIFLLSVVQLSAQQAGGPAGQATGSTTGSLNVSAPSQSGGTNAGVGAGASPSSGAGVSGVSDVTGVGSGLRTGATTIRVGAGGSTKGLGNANVPGAAIVTQTGQSELSLEQAIALAINNNLTTLLARERQSEARGLQRESLSGLLPNIGGTAYQASLTQNLAALGFQPGTFPGLRSTFIGPFNNFDARARLVQSVFNLSAIRNYQAGKAGVRVAELEEALAREQVASATALTYLEAIRAERLVIAAQSNVELAETLLTLARDQRNTGVATGVDVTRAETRLAEEQVRLAQAQTSAEQARLNLQRIAGLPLGSQLTLTDSLRFTTTATPSIETALAQASENRPEVRIAQAQVSLNDYERRAVRAELLPSVDFVGDYGVSGITPTNTALPTRRVAVQLNVPVFNGGLTRGRIEVAASRLRQTELQLNSIKVQVEEDVRLAFATLRTTTRQVVAADQSVALAEKELQMARDRFRAGVGDNIEVVTAQAALSNAREEQVTALAQYNAARLNLASSLGRAEAFRW